MISTCHAPSRNEFPGKGTEPPLHPVSDDRAADLLSDSEADAHARIRILAVANKKNEAGGGHAHTAIGGDEIRALLNGC